MRWRAVRRRSELIREDGLLERLAAALLLHGNAYVQLIAGGRRCAGGIVSDAARAGQRRDRRARVSGGLSVSRGEPDGADRGEGCAEPAAGGAYSRAEPRRRSLWDGVPGRGDCRGERPQSRRAGGTRRCSTMRRGLRGRWSTSRATGAGCRSSSSTGCGMRWRSSFRAAGNAGRPMLLEGGLKWQALSLSPADMDFVALKEGGGARHRAGVRGAAGAGRAAGRCDLRQCARGGPGAVPADGAAAGGDDLTRAGDDAERLAGAGQVRGRSRRITELAEDRARLWAQVERGGFSEPRRRSGSSLVSRLRMRRRGHDWATRCWRG